MKKMSVGLGEGGASVVAGKEGVAAVVVGARCDAAEEWVARSSVWREVNIINSGGWREESGQLRDGVAKR